jgi:hypothetical protein
MDLLVLKAIHRLVRFKKFHNKCFFSHVSEAKPFLS